MGHRFALATMVRRRLEESAQTIRQEPEYRLPWILEKSNDGAEHGPKNDSQALVEFRPRNIFLAAASCGRKLLLTLAAFFLSIKFSRREILTRMGTQL
jgi:hypothetical protein